MRLFDVLGPVMTGPSSSHTAGAVRIGSTARRLLGEQPAEAEILLYGSFAATGRGHGTDRALVAGLLGMQPDDDRIPHSFSIAKEAGLHFKIGTTNLRGAHPNTAVLRLTGASAVSSRSSARPSAAGGSTSARSTASRRILAETTTR